jgi:hypothetical protein
MASGHCRRPLDGCNLTLLGASPAGRVESVVRRVRALIVVVSVAAALQPVGGRAEQKPGASGAVLASHANQDGQDDFDFEIGVWKTHLRRLVRPLTGSSQWVEYQGTSVVRSVLDGRANLVELRVAGPAGRIEGVSLRLYNPQARQWSLNFASLSGGTMSPPVFGEFKGGRGEFYGPETLDGRAILARFVMTEISADSWRFEQAFSADGGRTWEVNWIATDTRMADEGPSK